MNKFKIMNAFQIKIIMVILMLLDHLSYINNLVPPEVASIFHNHLWIIAIINFIVIIYL